jgi:pseudouridine synthase
MNTLSIQKYLQSAGFDSRRNIRKLINEGKLKVNGKVIRDPNYLIEKTRDKISYRNKVLQLKVENKTYFIFNKPPGVISTLSDPQKRFTLKDYIKKIKERVYPVGRLDYNSEGLILLTNDGDLTQFIISVKNKIPKSYLIKIKGILNEESILKLKNKGIFMEGRKIRPLEVKMLKKTPGNNSWVQVTIIEGKKHVIRKLFQYAGHPVEKLKRIAIGNIKLKNLPPGHWRELKKEEIEGFKRKFAYDPSNSRPY